MASVTLHNWESTRKFLFSWKGILVIICISYFSFKEVSFDFGLSEAISSTSEMGMLPEVADYTDKSPSISSVVRNISQTIHEPVATVATTTKSKVASTISSDLANTYSNLTYTDPKLSATSSSAPASSSVAAKRKKQRAYVARYADSAIKEMKKYGIPASITLAQGLIESNCGESRLAKNNNNHFGIKCFSRTCGRGHCSNFTDDTHKDFFRKYKSSWESYRSHSILLQKDRYKPLFKLSKTDYKGWARGLKKAGYATDPLYADKLINLIQALDLHEYDKK